MINIKSIVFISNYFNHHQKPLSDAFFGNIGNKYYFIETEKMSEWRKQLGYEMESYPAYVVREEVFFNNKEYYQKIINEADVVIIGSAPDDLIKERIKKNQLVFRYSERPLRNGIELWKYPFRYIKWNKKNPRNKKIYMLCASAYTAGDYAKFGLFRNKCFKWGYFTETIEYNEINKIMKLKQPASILWVARLIKLKHPEAPIYVARKLKEAGYSFKMNIIGIGPLEDEIRAKIQEYNLQDNVFMLGSMKPREVRSYMEKAKIFLFTSDQHEGWGAVLNEAMNSGCSVVANRDIGSVPFLMEDQKNGLIYKSGDLDDLYLKVKFLIDNEMICEKLGIEAYKTIVDEWCAENATKRFIALAEGLLREELVSFSKGVCSKAEEI